MGGGGLGLFWKKSPDGGIRRISNPGRGLGALGGVIPERGVGKLHSFLKRFITKPSKLE